MPRSTFKYRFGDFQLDTRRRLLVGAEGVVPVQPKVFELLLFLVRNADAAVTKDELLDAVWAGTVVTESVLTRAVRALRQALGDDAADPRYVRALRGVGYRFVAPVARVREEKDPGRLRSLAVFPFRSLAAVERDEALELGLADTLIAHLSRLPDLVVRSLASAQTCLAAGAGEAEAARSLGVDAYLETSLQAKGRRLRVNARLVSVEGGESLWSESFDQCIADVFELQDVICARIVTQLTSHVSEQDVAGVRGASVAPAAYREFLEGRLFASRHTGADAREAIEHFERALDMAPGYAEAWAALGECCELVGTEGGEQAGEHYAAARRASKRALALAPTLPEAQCLGAKIAWQFDWDWAGAEVTFRAALERYPNRGDLHIHYADFLCMLGRPDEGIEQAHYALSIDPMSPWFNTLLAQALYMAGRYEEAGRPG